MTYPRSAIDLSFAGLPVAVPDMLRQLRLWVECESPTYEAAAVDRMLDLALRDLTALGADCRRIPGDGRYAGCVKATWPHPLRDAPGILILGHMDTVHPIGTLQRLPWSNDGERCYGPGILDMKSGNLIALEAIRILAGTGLATPLAVTVMFTSDEEVGSPSTRALIEAEALRHKYVLVPEPARRDGGVVTGRYAVARYALMTRGRPSHAGLRPGEGISAIREMAHQILAVERLANENMTLGVGVVRGGQWVNCVPTACEAEILVASISEDGLDDAVKSLGSLSLVDERVELVVNRTMTRPLWTASDRSWALYEHARAIAAELGFDIPHQNSSGGSDANFCGALGIATLDGLGARGDGPHTLGEHIIIDSLAERTRLMAGLLATLR